MDTFPIKEMSIGAGLGAIYALLRSYLSKKGILTMQLEPRPEAFDIDAHLHDLFVELQAYQDVDPEAYANSIIYCDRILLLEKQLRNHKVYPMPGDVTRIQTFRRRVMYELQAMMTKCNNDARRLSLLKRITMAIANRISEHYNGIATLCSRLRAEDALQV